MIWSTLPLWLEGIAEAPQHTRRATTLKEMSEFFGTPLP